MRARLLILLVASTACTVRGRLPAPGQIGIAVKTTVRADVHVEAPPPPAPIVAVQNAPVVEFFGIPLDDAQDVVFVLDCSGSMSDLAVGRLAQIQVSSTPPPSQGPPPPAASGEPVPPGQAPPPPVAPPPDAPPPVDGQPPPTDPNAAPPPPVVTQPRKIDVAKSELVDALSRLPAGTRMNVVFFNSDLEGFAPTLVPLDEGGRENVISFVREQEPTGSTALAPAMRTAFMMNAHRIVLLSDGLGNVGGNSDAVIRDAREAMRGGVRIDTIGVGAGQDGRLLSTLAGESGGLYQAL